MKYVNLINLFNSYVVVQLIVVIISYHCRILIIFYGLLLVFTLIGLIFIPSGLFIFGRFIRVIGVILGLCLCSCNLILVLIPFFHLFISVTSSPLFTFTSS